MDKKLPPSFYSYPKSVTDQLEELVDESTSVQELFVLLYAIVSELSISKGE